MANPLRGEVWMIDLDPVRGHEQAGKRPALVVWADEMNAGSSDLVVVVPITSKGKGIPTQLSVTPPEGGLTAASFVIAEQIRCVSKNRLSRRLGHIKSETMNSVERVTRSALDLGP